MDKYYVKSDVISAVRMNNMSKDGDAIKCRGPVLVSNGYGNVPSRYLREPTGSCHDLCKYGRKHDSEHREKRLTFRRFIANSIALEAAHSLVKDPIVGDRKKKLAIKVRASDTGKIAEQNIQPKKVEISDMLTPSSKHESNLCYSQIILPENLDQHTGSLDMVIGLSDSSNISFETSSPTHKNMEPIKEIEAQAKDDEKDQLQVSAIVVAEKNTNAVLGDLILENKNNEVPPQVIYSIPLDEEINYVKNMNSRRNKKDVNIPKASLAPKPTPVKSSILKQKSSASTKAYSGGDTSFYKEKAILNLKESIMFETLKVIKQKNAVVGKQSASSKLQSNNQNAFVSPRRTNGSAKTASSLILRSSMNASRSLNGWTKPEGNSINEMPEIRETKSLRSRSATISSIAPVHCAVSLKGRKSKFVKHTTLKKSGNCNEGYGDINEKILEVIKLKSEGKNLELNQESLSKEYDEHASESTGSEVSEHSLNGRIRRKHKCITSKEVEKRRARISSVPPSDSSSSPYKLKFKKGKVIELQAAESVGPRRLRFRRGRVLGENPSGEVMKRSFRRKRDVGDSNDSNLEVHNVLLKKANLESKDVKLKHRDSHGKKDVQALFNHVIEETANKLVETRKSKVKALVGAFESVILLQETKQGSAV